MEARQQKDLLLGLTFGGAAMNERSDVDALDRNKCADATRPRLLTVHCVSSEEHVTRNTVSECSIHEEVSV